MSFEEHNPDWMQELEVSARQMQELCRRMLELSDRQMLHFKRNELVKAAECAIEIKDGLLLLCKVCGIDPNKIELAS